MVSRVAAFVIWAAVAASVVYWALKLWVRPMGAPAHAVVVSTSDAFSGDPSRVLGADAPVPHEPTAAAPQAPQDPRFRLIGVVASRGAGAGSTGVALIATDGRPPKAYRVGAPVDGEMVLLAVRPRGASLGPRGEAAQVDLQLPALPSPAATSGATLPRPPALPPRAPQVVPLPQMSPPQGQQSQDDTEADTPPPDAPGRPMVTPPTGGTRAPT
jgi:general secretion pathway protein C